MKRVLLTQPIHPIAQVRLAEFAEVVVAPDTSQGSLRRTPEDLERLQQILRDSGAAMARGETLAEFDAVFHKAIVAATKNDVLLRFINVFYLMSRKRREIYFQEPQQSRRSHAQHLQLYRAIEAQDAERGQQILRRHLMGVDAYFRMFFSEPASAKAAAARPARPAHKAATVAAAKR